MGGIINIEYLFPDEFINFSQTAELVVFKKKPSANWREIPFPYMSVNPTVSSGETNDALYAITLTIKVIGENITVLKTIHARGCIIRYTTAEGKKEMVGSPQYPLFGPLSRVIGKTAKDYSGYELNLTGSSIYPPLPYLEI